MANMKIEDIEGIGPAYGEKLRECGVKDTDTLLEQGCTKAGRKKLAEASGLDEKRILKWVNMADLCRISGVGEEYSELLEGAGVDTVKELRTRNAANLTKACADANEQKNYTRKLPTEKVIQGWIDQAKELPPKIEY